VRRVLPNQPLSVIQHGVNRAAIFVDDEDRHGAPWAITGFRRCQIALRGFPNDRRRVKNRPPEPGSIDPPYERWKPELQSFQVMFGEDRVPLAAL